MLSAVLEELIDLRAEIDILNMALASEVNVKQSVVEGGEQLIAKLQDLVYDTTQL